nr:MAG TPA: AP2 domain protein [Caudoviricetes sp.]
MDGIMDEYIRFNGSRIKNIQGKHFGHLIPQRVIGIKNRYAIWECLCDLCGGTRQVSAKLLNGGSATMCEKCIKEKRKNTLNKIRYNENAIALRDFTGNQFGFWTVVKKGNYRNNTQTWVCKCICGKIKEVSVYDLINGRSISCGCSVSYNLIGKRIGRLKVVGVTEENGLSCVCQCDCGNIINCTASDLWWKRSCGCANDIEKEKHTKISIALGNKKIRKDNVSGFNGVRRANGKWGASITFQKKSYWLGTFDKIEDAVAARKEAERHLYGDFLEWYEASYKNKKVKE